MPQGAAIDRPAAAGRWCRAAAWAANAIMLATAPAPAPAQAGGPLTVSDTHPPVFVDSSGRAVYLAGSHTWNNLVDMDADSPASPFDYAAYLQFLVDHQFNLTRLWAWELPAAASERYPRRQVAEPLPWARTGPGLARDQRPRFDLSQFDSEYFQRLHERVSSAEAKGIYVIVMLFEGWAVQFAPGKLSHPFGADNNINGINFGDDPRSIHTLKHTDILAVQTEYLRKVVDTVNEFDNVLYEIVNEAGQYSTEWQAYMISELARYQATKPRQHPIGMTFQYPDGKNATLVSSEADWISPGADGQRLLIDPPAAMGTKVVISDSDHLVGSAGSNEDWVWRSFMRGMNLLYMDRYVPPDAVTGDPYARAHHIRVAMGDTRLIADALQAGPLVPRPDLSTTGFALAGNDVLLAYQPHRDRFIVDATALAGVLQIEWLNIVTGRTVREEPREGGGDLVLRPPFGSGSVVLISRNAREERQTFRGLEDELVALRRAAAAYLHRDRFLMEQVRQFLGQLVPFPSYGGLVYAFFLGAATMLLIVLSLIGILRTRRWRFSRKMERY